MDIFTLLVAAALVLFGRSLYWLFVGGIGFLLGFHYASEWFINTPAWVALLVALGAGLLGAILSIVLQRIALALAGFFAGGWFVMSLLPALNVDADRFGAIAFIVAGLVAAILVVVFLDPALVVLSALLGASMIATSPLVDPAWQWPAFAALFLLGIVVQFSLLHRSRASRASPANMPPPA